MFVCKVSLRCRGGGDTYRASLLCPDIPSRVVTLVLRPHLEKQVFSSNYGSILSSVSPLACESLFFLVKITIVMMVVVVVVVAVVMMIGPGIQ